MRLSKLAMHCLKLQNEILNLIKTDVLCQELFPRKMFLSDLKTDEIIVKSIYQRALISDNPQKHKDYNIDKWDVYWQENKDSELDLYLLIDYLTGFFERYNK